MYNFAATMRHGFQGERSVVLPRIAVEMAEHDPLTQALFITDIGYYPRARHHHRERQEGINQYVLIYCVEGKGWYRVADRRYDVHAGQFFILPAGVPHEYGASDEASWTIYWVHFRGECAAIYADGAEQPQNIRVAQDSRIANRLSIFDDILSTLQDGDGIDDLRYASSSLHYFLASMRYLTQYRRMSRTPQSETSIVEAAKHYMSENIERRITLHDVVSYIGYSQSHFSAIFRKQTGQSPLAWFNRLKMEHAAHMLSTTPLHVNQICYKVGIDDALYFSRLFSKIIGMSPTEYRQRNRLL